IDFSLCSIDFSLCSIDFSLCLHKLQFVKDAAVKATTQTKKSMRHRLRSVPLQKRMRIMTCPGFQQLLDYLDGRLDRSASDAVSAHLASGCNQCDGDRE